MLEIAWTFPVWKPEEEEGPSDGRTVAVQARRALPIEKAYELVTDGDRRPLLILRECERCKGTDHALLSRSLDNEQTVLLTHWFRCVKLPPNILEKDHPLTNLFKPEKEGDRIPHLFFVDPDGSHKQPLPGDQSQSVLWDTMFSYLDRCYEGNAENSVKQLRKILDQYDRVDGLEQETKNRIDREIEKRGVKSPKLKQLDKQLEKLEKERQKLTAKEKDLRALALKALAEKPEQAEAAAAGK
ncbi:MAG: hypothetical protein KDC98_09145 [Planctomycetes bacterium]|nr:hypothetical protein [Planctomycetota bacterium]